MFNIAIPCYTELGLVPCIGTLNILKIYSYLKTVPPSHSQCQAVVAMRCYAAERCSLICLPSQMHLQDSIRLMPYDHKAATKRLLRRLPWTYGFHMDFIWISYGFRDMVITGRTYHQRYGRVSEGGFSQAIRG